MLKSFPIVRSSLSSTTLMIVVITVMAMILGVATGDATAGKWQGSVTTVDGHKVVTNPAKGYEAPAKISLEELWRLGGDTEDEDEFFGIIADIEIDDDGSVYLLDAQLNEVKIYNAEGEFVRSIGREGEGPGEFRGAASLFFTKDGNVAVVQLMPAKVVLLSKEGDPLGEMPLPKPADGGFQLIQGASSAGGNLVIHLARQEFDQATGVWQRRGSLLQIHEDGTEHAEYTSKMNKIVMADAKMVDSDWDTFERRWTIGPDGKVYTCEDFGSYAINVYNADGTVDKVIQREYEHLARTAEEKDFMNKMFSGLSRQIPGCKVEIHEYNKDIENIFVRDDGSIWVLTSHGSRDLDEGTAGIFDVYNSDGHFVKTITLLGQGDAREDNYLFVKDRVYVVTSFLAAVMSAQGVTGLYDEDEEPEPMAVISYKLDRDILAAR